jgi:xanthosine utilization system XapX-like protein
MWSWIKKQFSKAWNFIKKHFHKAIAVAGAGLTMVTVEVFGLLAVDMLLLPFAMVSIIGLIGLCFGYFLVIFAAITIGMELFNYLWVKCELEEVDYDALDVGSKAAEDVQEQIGDILGAAGVAAAVGAKI